MFIPVDRDRQMVNLGPTFWTISQNYGGGGHLCAHAKNKKFSRAKRHGWQGGNVARVARVVLICSK